MALGFALSSGSQEGTLSLNNKELKMIISFNDKSLLYNISLYNGEDPIFVGRDLVDGGDLLYNMKFLDLGTSLIYRKDPDGKTLGYLLYEA